MRFPTAHWPEVRRVLGRHLRLIPGARRIALFSVVLLAAGSAATIFIPILLGRVVDVVIGVSDGGQTLQDGLRSLGVLGILLAISAIVGAALSAWGFYMVAQTTEQVIANLREEMVGTALGLPVHRVEDAGTGDLVSRSTDDVAALSSAVTQTAPTIANSAFSIGVSAVALVSLSWHYIVVVFFAGCLYTVACRSYLKNAPERYAAERASVADRARRLLEAVRGKETVRAFGLEDQMHDDLNETSLAVVNNGFRARRTMMVLQLWMTTVECVMLTTGLVIGYIVVQSQTLSVGAVTAAMLMLIRLRGPMMGLMRVLDTIQSGYASLARIVGVVQDPPEPTPPAGAPARVGRVEMDHVSFSYGDGWAVKDISLTIEPGETIALVGSSGAGKTTVAALLAGLRVPDTGRVTVDGVEVSHLSDSERVARLAMVSQDVHVFSGSLRDDLHLAAPDATDEELIDALERVGADWYSQLADGLDTEIGARGITLEPVYAQQLALARMLLLDPKVVVMDEATAEAGSVGAESLEEAAEVVTRGRSALVVAHRLDQAARADRVLVMADGVVVEQGRHEELLSFEGRYSKLWAAWRKGRD